MTYIEYLPFKNLMYSVLFRGSTVDLLEGKIECNRTAERERRKLKCVTDKILDSGWSQIFLSLPPMPFP